MESSLHSAGLNAQKKGGTIEEVIEEKTVIRLYGGLDFLFGVVVQLAFVKWPRGQGCAFCSLITIIIIIIIIIIESF